jgi:uncharacterized protein with HEPN domain
MFDTGYGISLATRVDLLMRSCNRFNHEFRFFKTFVITDEDGGYVGLQMDEFLKDETLKRAAVRSLEIIGEASKKIPVDQKLRWPGIPWKNMAGMRDRLIHDYMGVNYLIVWDVMENFIPELKILISQILEATGPGN